MDYCRLGIYSLGHKAVTMMLIMAVVPAIILASIGGALIALVLVNGFIWLANGGGNRCPECRKRWGHKPCCTTGRTHDMQAVYVASLASGVPVITHNACRRCGYKGPLTGAGLQQEYWKSIGGVNNDCVASEALIELAVLHDTRRGEFAPVAIVDRPSQGVNGPKA